MTSKTTTDLRDRRALASRGGRLLAAVLALSLLLVGNVALADTLTINVLQQGGQKTVDIVAGNSATVNYSLVATDGDGDNGCNVAQGNNSRADVTLSLPTGVTASSTSSQWAAPNRFDLRGCGEGNGLSVSFASATVGTHTITATIQGRSGVSGSFTTTEATFRLRVSSPTPSDTTPPVLHLPAGITTEAASAAGAVVSYAATATDNVTPTPTVTCTPASGSTFPIAVTTVNCSATDAAGNTSTGSFEVAVRDTTAPTLTLSGDLTREATSASGAVVAYSVVATDAVDPSPAVDCTPASGSSFPLGTTTVNCTGTDATGNASSGSFTVTVGDDTDPVVRVEAPLTVEATGELTDVEYEVTGTDEVGIDSLVCEDADATPFGTDGGTFPLGTTTVTCTATDTSGNTGAASFTVEVLDTTGPRLDLPATLVAEATSPDGAEVSYTATATDLVDGAVDVNCTPVTGTTFPTGTTPVDCSAEDAAGNPSEGRFDVVVRDTTAPTLDLPEDLDREATGPDGASVAYEIVTTDAASSPTLECADEDGEAVSATGQVFPLGTTRVECVATDGMGNTNTGSFNVTVRDTTAPAIAVPNDITAEATSAAGAEVEFEATALDLVDGEVAAVCEPASGSVFALGATTVTCTATDSRGNEGSEAFEVTVEDTTVPLVTVPANITEEATGPNGTAVIFAASAGDAVDGAIVPTCEPASGSTFALGTHTVTCTATDAAGNTGSGSFTVTVRDTDAPIVEEVDDVTAEATGPSGATVTFDDPDANDVVDGALVAACVPASGSLFALGDTTVTCSATDRSDNTGTGGFVVRVVDTTRPEMTLPADQIVEATGPSGAAATWTASATDLVDGSVAVVCDHAPGDTFGFGATTVACTATDGAGNRATGSFTVTVEDTTRPDVTVPADITAEATGAAGAAISYSGAVATDLVDGTVAASCEPPSGDVFPIGSTTVTCTATDAAGNEGTGSFTVRVRDTTAPVLSLPSDQVVTASSASGAAVAYTATATDVVDGAVPVTCAPASGTTFGIGRTTVDCSASDAAGNTTRGSFTVTVGYSTSGFLQPINPNGTSVFKLNSTVPVKFRFTGDSAGIGDANAKLMVSKLSNGVAGTETEAVATNNADSGGLFRYDAKDDQYIYNLATKGLGEGTYQLRIDLADGVTRTVQISIRR